MPEVDVKFQHLSTDQALTQLESTTSGLTTAEVRRRQKYYGLNRLPQSARSGGFKVFLEQLKSPLVYVLLAAALISLALNEVIDASVILMAVVIQVAVGFVQEFKAQTSLAALQQVIALLARVRRDNKEQVIDATQLVPGDIVYLQAGDKIPADMRLFEIIDFSVNEAALTGESDDVQKDAQATVAADAVIADRINLAFAGTVATKGSAVGVVTHTAQHTEVGQIAQLIKDTKEEDTPLQAQLASFAKKVSIAVVGIAVVIFLFGYFVQHNLVEMFTVAVAVAVSAIPEGLAIAVTVILAAGMQRVLQRKALVRKLVAAETLGSTNVICTDKTGTLTEGKMQVTDVVTWESNFAVDGKNLLDQENRAAKDLLFALRLGLLCNDAKVNNPEDMMDEWVISGNLTERALLFAATQAGLHYATVNKSAPRLDTLPFDSTNKYMASLHREAQGRMLYVKGAPEVVLAHCKHVMIEGKPHRFDDAKQKQFEEKFLQLSQQGLRIIALAYKDCDKAKTIAEATLDDLVFVGYVGIKDPLRPTAKTTVAECKRAGIKTVMITGDHKLTALAIATELGIVEGGDVSQVVEGFELDAMPQHELNKRVQDIAVYARVTPQHKYRIVQAWQSHGKVVAMTGDGINDAPAIKAADIGVALGSGTDVAKETADMVILDDNFGTIVAAVEEGRGIFDNIKKTVLYLLSDSFTEVLLVVVALLAGLPVPVTAAMILWINIVNDSFPSLAMTQEPKEPESMLEAPRGRDNRILDTEVKTLIAVISLVTGVVNLGLFWFIYTRTGDVDLARTVIFLSLGLDSLLFMFSIRSLRKLIYQTKIFANPWLVAAFVLGVVVQAVPIYVPKLQKYFGTVAIGWQEWALVLSVIIAELALIELCKFIFLQTRAKRKRLAATGA